MKELTTVILAFFVAASVIPTATIVAPPFQTKVAIIGTLPPAYVGTDYIVDVKVSGLNNPRLLLRDSATETYSAAITPVSAASMSAAQDVIASAYIPGSEFKHAGKHNLMIRGTSASGATLEFGPYPIEVLMPPNSAAMGDSQLASVGVESTYTRWFYDVEKNGNMLNGVNISNIASQIKSPIRDSSGTVEQWPAINFSHNLPETGTTSDAVQPHRGLDIARTNGQPVWAVIGATVTAVDAPNMIVTTSKDLDGNGTIDLYVQYEHVIPATGLTVGSTITQSTIIGTVGELNHVHVRFDNPSRFSMPQNLFWLDSPWVSSNNVDFVRNPTASGAQISVTIHGLNVGAQQYGYQTRVYHRLYGGVSYFRYTDMTKQADGITWKADISAYYSPGDVIEYYIETMRSDLTGTANSTKTVYRPVYYKMYWNGTQWQGIPPIEYYKTIR